MSAPKTPSKPAPGRPCLHGQVMRNRVVRMTDAQWRRFQSLGGAKWLRQVVESV